MKRFVYITVALIALFLLFRGSPAYNRAIQGMTRSFRKIYGALVQGKP